MISTATGQQAEIIKFYQTDTNIAGTHTLPNTSLRASWAHGVSHVGKFSHTTPFQSQLQPLAGSSTQ